jgi:hypothetical protein
MLNAEIVTPQNKGKAPDKLIFNISYKVGQNRNAEADFRYSRYYLKGDSNIIGMLLIPV